MGDLPANRFSQIKASTEIGIDFCGPFYLTYRRVRGSKPFKAYVCVIVCFSTKALHLELVSDLTSDACLAALRRFVARRGTVTTIHSDQGTNFIGASNQLRDLFKSAAESQGVI